jgi:phenylpyruvate tautomerase PptA (4-oxalocrotonate tautomerase family)
MPLIYVNAPAGTFSNEARDALAEELTSIGMGAEQIPQTPFARSTTWIYFRELDAAHVYHGGATAGTKVISLELNSFIGGIDDAAKLTLYDRATDAIRRHAGLPADARAPVYIVMRDVDPPNWGVFGGTTDLAAMRTPTPDLAPF